MRCPRCYAIDGFYAAVVQQLRPWAPKAPQLPTSGKTATEEAGIDITPPPGDVIEQAGFEAPQPGDPDTGDNNAITAALDMAEAVVRPRTEPAEHIIEPDDEEITWSGAEDRLERERLNEMNTAPTPEGE